jgi:exopolysaccharide biosynthesis protein
MDEEFIKSHMKQTSYIKKCILFLILFIMILSAFSYGYRLYYFKKAYEEVRRDQPVQVETTITEY